MELTRKQIIDLLEKADSTVYKEPKTKLAQALEYAISFIKTDEAYQLMYDSGDIFSKSEKVAMLTELQTEIEDLPMYCDPLDISDLIQQKIDKLKENKDMKLEEIKNYDTCTDTTLSKIVVGTDGNLYRLSVSGGNEHLSKTELDNKTDKDNLEYAIRTFLEKHTIYDLLTVVNLALN